MITYKDAGVNIEEGYKSVKLIKEYAQRTMSEYVLNGLGSFAGMVELPEGYKKPVLVSGTDGVGTKLELAFKTKKYDTVGIDCVAMCVNEDGKTREEVVKTEIEDNDNNNLTIPQVVNRLGMVF